MNMLIGQSGGPTAAINASLSGAIKRAMKHQEIDKIYGARYGLEGVLAESFVDLREHFRSTADFYRLETTPAMALGSCRYKLPPYPNPVYDQILDIFRRNGIGYFFYIGGNDSMDTVLQLSDFFATKGLDIKCVGIPKTIDNDLPCTDHTPGFGSAAKYIATSVAEIACDSVVYDIPSINVVEIMGRNSGWLTASSALARREGCAAPHLIYLPEVPFCPDQFVESIRELQKTVRNIIIAVSEGIRFKDGGYVSASSDKRDAFGHFALAGAGRYLEGLINEEIGGKVRSIELNVLQRSASHLQSATDIAESCRIGAEAVGFAIKGETGVMAIFRRISDDPYLVTYGSADIQNIANQEKIVPLDWIAKNGCDVTSEMLSYLRPLIADHDGAGIPTYFTL